MMVTATGRVPWPMASGSGARSMSVAATMKAAPKQRGQGMPTPLFVPPWVRWVEVYYPPPYPNSPDSFQAENAKQKIMTNQWMKNWGWLMSGLPKNIWEPHLSPPPMHQIRDLVKGKGVAPAAAPTEILLGENPDAALSLWL